MSTQPTENPLHPQAPSPMTAAADGNPAIDLIQLVLKNRNLLIAGCVAGIVLGVLAYLKMGPSYVANSQVLVSRKVTVPIRDQQNGVVGERSAHVAIIVSPMIVGRAVEESKLTELTTLKTAKEPVVDIINSLVVKRIAGEDRDQLNVLDVEYKSSNRDDAEKIVDAIIAAYDRYLSESRRDNSRELLRQTMEANHDLSLRVAEKNKEIDEFRQKSPMIFKAPPGAEGMAGFGVNIHQDRAENISLERRKVEIKLQENESKMQILKQAIADGESQDTLEFMVRSFMQTDQKGPSQTVITGGNTRVSLETQLIPLLLEKEKLLQDFDIGHPEVINVKQRIQTVIEYYRKQGISAPNYAGKEGTGNSNNPDQLNLKGVDLVATYLEALKQMQKELEFRDEGLRKRYDEATKEAKEYAAFSARDQQLNEELAQIKSLQTPIVRSLDEFKLVKDNEGYRLQQISPSRAELDFKKIVKIIGGCMMLGIISVLGFIYLMEMRDTTFKTLEDIRASIKGMLLGSVPEFLDPTKNLDSAHQSGLDPMLYYFHQPGSAEAEAVRTVRTSLYVRAQDLNAKTIQISSPEPGDGKTTSASNLAIAMAQSGKRVLLIDADLRRPTVHSLFNLRRDVGLTDVLRHEIQLVNAVQKTAIEGLEILVAGQIPDKPAELLSRTHFELIVAEAEREYDYVIIDSPPVLAVSDPCIIAPATDGLLLVIRMRKNRKASLKRVEEMLAAHSVRLLGVVANGVEHSTNEYIYNGGYHGGYQAPVALETAPIEHETHPVG